MIFNFFGLSAVMCWSTALYPRRELFASGRQLFVAISIEKRMLRRPSARCWVGAYRRSKLFDQRAEVADMRFCIASDNWGSGI